MAKRYSGEAIVHIKYVGYKDGKDEYAGKIVVGEYIWKFDSLYAPQCGFDFAYDSPKAYDKMAESAISFGSYYTSGNRGGDTPDWAPSAEVADAIDSATGCSMDDGGDYEVSRKPIL